MDDKLKAELERLLDSEPSSLMRCVEWIEDAKRAITQVLAPPSPEGQ